MNKTQIKNTKTSALQKIRKDIDSALYDRNNIKRDKENKKFLNKYFKVRNSYSCPETESDWWWLYFHANKLENGELRAMSFQRDKDGKINVEKSTWCSPRNGYIEISEDEFNFEFDKIIIEINELRNNLPSLASGLVL